MKIGMLRIGRGDAEKNRLKNEKIPVRLRGVNKKFVN